MNKDGRLYGRTLWGSFLTLVILLGVYAAYLRRLEGWSTEAPLKQIFPWGLCAGMDVSCGLALAVGGFTIAGVLYLAGFEVYRPILRIGILTGLVGFIVAVLATIANRPFRPWAFVALWSPWGRFLGLGLALALYSLLFVLELVPVSLRRPWLRLATVLLAITCAFLSASQQSSFAKLLTIARSEFSPLWVTPMLSVQLYLSSICASLACVIFASQHTALVPDRKLPATLVDEIAKGMGVLLSLYVIIRVVDLLDTSALPLLLHGQRYNYLLGIELCLFLLPALLLIRRNEGCTARRLHGVAVLVTAGLVVNRLNTTITARETVAGLLYVPQWKDVMIASGAIAIGLVLFGLALRYLPILETTESSTTRNSISQMLHRYDHLLVLPGRK